MDKNNIFPTYRWRTNEKIDIPLKDINRIESRSSAIWDEVDHMRVFLNWINLKPHPLNDSNWLVLVPLEYFEDLVKACKNFQWQLI